MLNKQETNNNLIEDRISTSGKGIGFIKDPTKDEDILIEKENLGTALPGDIVRIQVVGVDKERRTGKVVAILSRARTQFVGTTVIDGEKIFISPDNHKIYTNFVLEKPNEVEIRENQKVLIKFENWKNDEEYPKVSLVKIIGDKGVHEVEIQSIIFEKGFESQFPEKIEMEAKKLQKKWAVISEEEIAKRRDLRGEDVITIDPADAKDFDDALSIKKLNNGNFEVGVHIADVSFYVTPDTELDKEAYTRSTSVYLVDRTIPMLPEILSNDLCSLNPGAEKLAFSAIFELSPDAKVINRWFGRTIIESKTRFSYEEAQAILDAGQGSSFDKLKILDTLAKKLQAQNRANGMLEFEREEIKFELDKDGRPLRIIKKQPLETHKLVENMMLLANREVAKFIYKKGKELGGNQNDLMYRVHDVPSSEKIENLMNLLKVLGYKLEMSDEGEITSKGLSKLFEEVRGKPEENLIKSAAIKTMSKAVYSIENTGHFGLGFHYYTHFTSPIRRYPDLLVHRILQNYLSGNKLDSKELATLEKSTAISTEQEIAASEASRESIKYKQAEYMQDHIGEEFEGVISGVTSWGLYIQIKETLSEGMIHISKLGDDFFSLDEKNYAIVGKKTNKKFKLGDKITVKISKVDLEQNNIDMDLVSKRK